MANSTKRIVGHDDPVSATLGALLLGEEAPRWVPEENWVELVRSMASGDQLALRELYGRSHSLVFTLTLRIVRDAQVAEELTIDVFHDLWKRAASYHPDNGTVVGWIMNQARSRAIDRLRFERRQKRVNPFPDEEEAVEDEGAEAQLDARTRDQQLYAAVAQLKPAEREAIELAFFADETYEEVAVKLQAPTGTVKTRIRSGIDKLRRALTDTDQT